jgi:hypothetical protein
MCKIHYVFQKNIKKVIFYVNCIIKDNYSLILFKFNKILNFI